MINLFKLLSVLTSVGLTTLVNSVMTDISHKFYLKDSHLSFNQQKFNSPEVRFNNKTMQVTAQKMTLSNTHRISRKLRFKQKVEAVTYPYKKIAFYQIQDVKSKY